MASVTLSSTSQTLLVGTTAVITATARDATGTAIIGRTATWSSSAPAVATVNNGAVTGVSPGQATVTATIEGKSATAQITVNAPPPATCESTVPIGRLTFDGAPGYSFFTSGNWRVMVRPDYTVRILVPGWPWHLEFWGAPTTPQSPVLTHENLTGKHIKDRLMPARTVHLTDGTTVTLFGLDSPETAGVSIYDQDQTHRIMFKDLRLTHSCAIGRFGETDEADGEASEVVMNAEGMLWRNTYTQEELPGRIPGPKIPGITPLGQTSFININQVIDFYDDPRLGHT